MLDAIFVILRLLLAYACIVPCYYKVRKVEKKIYWFLCHSDRVSILVTPLQWMKETTGWRDELIARTAIFEARIRGENRVFWKASTVCNPLNFPLRFDWIHPIRARGVIRDYNGPRLMNILNWSKIEVLQSLQSRQSAWKLVNNNFCLGWIK